jgi:hypothetical protein
LHNMWTATALCFLPPCTHIRFCSHFAALFNNSFWTAPIFEKLNAANL